MSRERLTQNGGDVLFNRGHDLLRSAADMLRKADFSGQVPAGSKALLVRHGILSCSPWTKQCQFVMMTLPSSSLVSRSFNDYR